MDKFRSSKGFGGKYNNCADSAGRGRYKIAMVAALLASACLLTYYFYTSLKIGVVITHVFYIPIVVAALWWRRKGLIVAVFSSVFLVLSHIFLRPDVANIHDYCRVFMFLVTGSVVAVLSEYIAKDEEALRAANEQLTAGEQQLRAANEQLTASEQQLRAANQQLKADEEELRRLNRDLAERVKELNCLYGLSRLVEQPDITLEQIFEGLAELIPLAWEYPDITCAQMVFEGRRFKTPNFRKTKWIQSADIKVFGKKAGAIEVYYARKMPELDEGPFLTEERKLINNLAVRLGIIIERKQEEQQLQAANEQLTASEQQLRAANQQLAANGQQLKVANQQLKAANQQLIASEQQLKAANEQLTASEQQLRAANQQLQTDIAERKRMEEKIRAALREKEVLLKEVHHRVKNNMQVISSILNLQSRHIKNNHTLKVFADSQNRIRSMALVHEKLYESEDLAKIDFAEYVRSMTGHLSGLHEAGDGVRFTIDIKGILLDINTAIPCGLIINELVSNSLKYAFPKGRGGEIHIGLHSAEGDRLVLTVKDNGIGLPKGLDFRKTESLGMQLVIMLTEQLDGSIEVDKKKGTTFRITFADPNHNQRRQ